MGELSTKGKSRAGLMLDKPHGANLCYALNFCFDTSNNETKYEALIIGLKLARAL